MQFLSKKGTMGAPASYLLISIPTKHPPTHTHTHFLLAKRTLTLVKYATNRRWDIICLANVTIVFQTFRASPAIT